MVTFFLRTVCVVNSPLITFSQQIDKRNLQYFFKAFLENEGFQFKFYVHLGFLLDACG